MTKRTSYMQFIYIDSDDQARHTNMRAAFETNAATWAQFKLCKRLEVAREKATFLLDYHNQKGDLGDTILIDDAGFETITGEKRKTEDAYRRIDEAYWFDARKEYEARNS